MNKKRIHPEFLIFFTKKCSANLPIHGAFSLSFYIFFRKGFNRIESNLLSENVCRSMQQLVSYMRTGLA